MHSSCTSMSLKWQNNPILWLSWAIRIPNWVSILWHTACAPTDAKLLEGGVPYSLSWGFYGPSDCSFLQIHAWSLPLITVMSSPARAHGQLAVRLGLCICVFFGSWHTLEFVNKAALHGCQEGISQLWLVSMFLFEAIKACYLSTYLIYMVGNLSGAHWDDLVRVQLWSPLYSLDGKNDKSLICHCKSHWYKYSAMSL